MKRFFILLLASLLLLTAGCNKEKASDVKTVSVQLPDRHWYGEFFSVAPARILSCGPGGFLCDADQGRSLRRDGGQIPLRSDVTVHYGQKDGAYTVTQSRDGSYALVTPRGDALPLSPDLFIDSAVPFHLTGNGEFLYLLSGQQLYSVEERSMEALDQSVRWLGIGAVADTVYGVGSVQERSDAEGTSPALFLYQLRGTEASCLLRLDMEDDLPRLVCGGRTYAGLSLHRRASE